MNYRRSLTVNCNQLENLAVAEREMESLVSQVAMSCGAASRCEFYVYWDASWTTTKPWKSKRRFGAVMYDGHIMAKTIAALFRTQLEGEAAYNKLLSSGFTRDQVSFVAGHPRELSAEGSPYGQHISRPSGWREE